MDSELESMLKRYLTFLPQVMYKPKLSYWHSSSTAGEWRAIYGDVVGKGKTPADALNDFDLAFNREK